MSWFPCRIIMAVKKEKETPKVKSTKSGTEQEIKVDIINPESDAAPEDGKMTSGEDTVNKILDIQNELNESKDSIEEKLSEPDADAEKVIKAEIEHAQDMLNRLPDIPTTNVWNGVTYN